MEYGIGIACGILFTFIFVALFYRLVYKKEYRGKKGPFHEKEVYDERQLLARGSAYKAGFFSLLGYILCLTICNEINQDKSLLTTNALLLGIILSVGIFAIVCIMKDAYMSLYENSKIVLILFFIIGLINVVGIGIPTLLADANPQEKSNGFINLASGTMILIVAIVFIIKSIHDKKDDE